MNIVGGQLLEAPAGAAPKPRARDNTQPAGARGFAAALERSVDAMAPQPAAPGAPQPDGRVKDPGDHAHDDAAPDDTIAALLAAVVPQLALAATRPLAERLPAARPLDPAAGAASTPIGRTALQPAAPATLGSAATAAPDAPDPLTSVDTAIAAAQRRIEVADQQPATPTLVPQRSAAPLGLAAAASAHAHGDQVSGDAITSQIRLQAGAPAARPESAEAASRGAAGLGAGLAAVTSARTAGAEAAPAAASFAATQAAAPAPDGVPAANALPLPAHPTAPMPRASTTADRYQTADDATGITASGSAAIAAPRATAAAGHERGSDEQAREHADSSPAADAVATLPGGLAPGVSGSSPARAEVAAPVGSPEWPAALGQQLAGLPRGQEVELDLHPAELGPLKVKLSMQDGQAQLAFVAASPMVRDAIEAALPQLKTNLAEHGIGLGQTSVGSGSGQAQAQHGSAHDQRGERAPQPGAAHPRERAPATVVASTPSTTRPRRGTIDDFA